MTKLAYFLSLVTSLASDISIDSAHVGSSLILSNNSIWLPPFQFAPEGNGASGAIYFHVPGHPVPDVSSARYILNMTGSSRDGRVEMLLSHHSIVIEEEPGGQIVLGNDGTSGGWIEVRYEDAFGNTLQTNIPGHSHVVMFSARLKDTNGVVHNALPAIVGFHGGGHDKYPTNPYGNIGTAGDGELAFFSHTPFPMINEPMIPGTEMGRMTGQGWNLYGQVTITNLNAGGITTNVYVTGLGGQGLRLTFKNGLLTGVTEK